MGSELSLHFTALLQPSKLCVPGYSVPPSTHLELPLNTCLKISEKHRAGDISSAVPSALSSQPHLPSRQGVDSHSFPSPAWVLPIAEVSVDTVIVVIHVEGRAVDLCLPDEGRAINSAGKLQAFACLVFTEDRRGRWIP